MKNITSIILLLLLISCTNQSTKSLNKLEAKIQTLHLFYVEWACECANWKILDEDLKHVEGDRLAMNCIFIEPANDNLKLPDTLGYNGDIIEVTGQFYLEKGYPNSYKKTEQTVDKARVFRYSNYKIGSSNYRNFSNNISE